MKKFAPLFVAAACLGAFGSTHAVHAAGMQPATAPATAPAMAGAPAAMQDRQNTHDARDSLSHHVQAATATRSAATVQGADAADAEVAPGYYALMLLGLGLVGFAAKRQSVTPKFAVD